MTLWVRVGAVALSLVLCADVAFAENGKKKKKTIAQGDHVTVTLKGEREIKGIYLGRHHNAVWVEVSGGEIGLDEDQVLKVTPSESAEHEFLRRKAALNVHDAKGFWELCIFASENNLTPQAQSAAQTGGWTGQVDLVADDQVIIEQREGQLVARAPPNLAGLLEVRGLGILEMPYAAETELCLVVDLARSRAIERLPDPMLSLDILGHRLPLMCLGAFEASAPLKVVLALMRRPIDP